MRSSSAHQLHDPAPAAPTAALLRVPLSRLKLPPPFVQSLRRIGVHRVGELLRCSRRELLCLRGVGPLTLYRAQEILRPLGIAMALEVRAPLRPLTA